MKTPWMPASENDTPQSQPLQSTNVRQKRPSQQCNADRLGGAPKKEKQPALAIDEEAGTWLLLYTDNRSNKIIIHLVTTEALTPALCA